MGSLEGEGSLGGIARGGRSRGVGVARVGWGSLEGGGDRSRGVGVALESWRKFNYL